MEIEVAKKVIDKMVESAREFDDLLFEIQEKSSIEEFKIYQKAFAKVMGFMLLDIMNPILKEHPDLKPPELD